MMIRNMSILVTASMLIGLATLVGWFSAKRTEARINRKRFSQWTYTLTHHPKFFRLLDVYVLRGFWFFFVLVLIVFVALFILVTLFELLPDIVKNRVDTSVVASRIKLLFCATAAPLRVEASTALASPIHWTVVC